MPCPAKVLGMAHDHDPNTPTEMCDEHLLEHAAKLIAELLKRDLLVVGEPHGDGLAMMDVSAMGIDNGKVYIAVHDGHGHGHGHHNHSHD